MNEINTLWGFSLPSRFLELYEKEDFNTIRRKDQEGIDLPFPLMEVEEIKKKDSLREDWEIPVGLVPFMGNMHDIVCLDYSEADSPAVVIINDQREKTKIADTFSDFLENVYLADEKDIDTSGIIEGESWLKF